MHYFVSGCENAKMYIWNIPENGLTETLTEPQSYLMGKYTPQYNNYVPPTKGGGGAYCFWCGSRRRPRSFVSVRYLLNRWTDFNQTCTDTLLGGRNKMIRFW